EVVRAGRDQDEARSEPVAVFGQGVEVLLGRVAEVARVEDRDAHAEPAPQLTPEAGRWRLVVADEIALHERVAQDDPPDRRRGVGLGSPAAPRVGRLARAG